MFTSACSCLGRNEEQLCSTRQATHAKQACLRKWKVVTGSGRGLCQSLIKPISSVRFYKDVCILKRQSARRHTQTTSWHPLTSFMLTQKKSSVCFLRLGSSSASTFVSSWRSRWPPWRCRGSRAERFLSSSNVCCWASNKGVRDELE